MIIFKTSSKSVAYHAIVHNKSTTRVPLFMHDNNKNYPKEVMSGHRKCSGRRPHVHTHKIYSQI